MKRFLMILLGIALTATLAGCWNNTTPDAPVVSPSADALVSEPPMTSDNEENADAPLTGEAGDVNDVNNGGAQDIQNDVQPSPSDAGL